MKDYYPYLPCKCGHTANFHRKVSGNGIFLTFNLLDCTKCECKKFTEAEHQD
jgi:hypothetical protein